MIVRASVLCFVPVLKELVHERHVSTEVRDHIVHVPCPRLSSELLGKRVPRHLPFNYSERRY